MQPDEILEMRYPGERELTPEQRLWVHVLHRFFLDAKDTVAVLNKTKKARHPGDFCHYQQLIDEIESEWVEVICDCVGVDYQVFKTIIYRELRLYC